MKTMNLPKGRTFDHVNLVMFPKAGSYALRLDKNITDSEIWVD
jgi:hypothetical protein